MKLGQTLDFEELAKRQSLVFLRLSPGDSVRLGRQAMLVKVEEKAWHCRAYPPWDEFEADGEGWYAVNYRPMTQHIGFSDLIAYRVASIPGQSFRLGFHADLDIRTAHVQGLLPLMRSRTSMRMLDAMNVLRAPMQEMAARALESTVGREAPELSYVMQKRDEIQRELECALFPFLYRNGLCMKPRSFLIQGFAPPMLK